MSNVVLARIVGAQLIAPWSRFEPVGATCGRPSWNWHRVVGARFIAPGAAKSPLHVHLIPRCKSNVEDLRGGVRWVVAEKVGYWDVCK